MKNAKIFHVLYKVHEENTSLYDFTPNYNRWTFASEKATKMFNDWKERESRLLNFRRNLVFFWLDMYKFVRFYHTKDKIEIALDRRMYKDRMMSLDMVAREPTNYKNLDFEFVSDVEIAKLAVKLYKCNQQYVPESIIEQLCTE